MMKRVSLLLLLIFAILLPVMASSGESASVQINSNVKEGTGVGDEDDITVGDVIPPTGEYTGTITITITGGDGATI